jgi:hypothetical protein
VARLLCRVNGEFPNRKTEPRLGFELKERRISVKTLPLYRSVGCALYHFSLFEQSRCDIRSC